MTLGFNIELFLLRLNGDIMEIQIFFFLSLSSIAEISAMTSSIVIYDGYMLYKERRSITEQKSMLVCYCFYIVVIVANWVIH